MIHDELKSIFDYVNDWLKFAETKNAALVAFDGAAVLGLISISENLGSGQVTAKGCIVVAFVFLSISLLIALVSFLPQTRSIKALPATIKPQEDRLGNDNLYFFEHILKYRPEDYLTKIKQGFESMDLADSSGTKKTQINTLSVDLSQQIIINSQIASRKYHYFKVALLLSISGMITSLIAWVAYIYCNPNW